MFLKVVLDAFLQWLDVPHAFISDPLQLALQIVISLALAHEYVLILPVRVSELRQLIDVVREHIHLILRPAHLVVLPARYVIDLILVSIDQLSLDMLRVFPQFIHFRDVSRDLLVFLVYEWLYGTGGLQKLVVVLFHFLV